MDIIKFTKNNWYVVTQEELKINHFLSQWGNFYDKENYKFFSCIFYSYYFTV